LLPAVGLLEPGQADSRVDFLWSTSRAITEQAHGRLEDLLVIHPLLCSFYQHSDGLFEFAGAQSDLVFMDDAQQSA
jgi:hypothetical protein